MSRGSEDERPPGAGVSLALGSKVVELLIPHRRPFLMVDHVRRFTLGPTPSIEAGRHLSLNEPVLGGHFPDLPLWPGVLTLEGLGQTGTLLLALTGFVERAGRLGHAPEQALEALRSLDRGYRLHPGFRPSDIALLGEPAVRDGGELAMGAAVDVKFLRPVFPGCRLDYFVELSAHLESRVRFQAEARVGRETVARGTITAALGVVPPSAAP